MKYGNLRSGNKCERQKMWICKPSTSSQLSVDSPSIFIEKSELDRPQLSSPTKSNTQTLLIPSLPNLRWLLQLQILLFLSTFTSAGIGCFVCSSFNKSNPECEDTFNSTIAHPSVGTVNNYQYPCWAFRQGRKGLFPADHCVKIAGYQLDNPSETIIIRTCALDSGSLTADTEIVRISHCGQFKYEGKQYSGCVQSCSTDGCNFGARISTTNVMYLISFVFLIVRL